MVYSPNTTEANAIFGIVNESSGVYFNREYGGPKGFATEGDALAAIANRPSGIGGCFVAFTFTSVGPTDYRYGIRFDAVPGGAESGLFGALGSWYTSRSFPDSLGQGASVRNPIARTGEQ